MSFCLVSISYASVEVAAALSSDNPTSPTRSFTIGALTTQETIDLTEADDAI